MTGHGDDEELAQALYRALYDAGVSFDSAHLIPQLVDDVRAAGYEKREPAADAEALRHDIAMARRGLTYWAETASNPAIRVDSAFARDLIDRLVRGREPVVVEDAIRCDYCGDALPSVASRSDIPTTPDLQRRGFAADKIVCPECATRPVVDDAMVRRAALAMYKRTNQLSMSGATDLAREALAAALTPDGQVAGRG